MVENTSICAVGLTRFAIDHLDIANDFAHDIQQMFTHFSHHEAEHDKEYVEFDFMKKEEALADEIKRLWEYQARKFVAKWRDKANICVDFD